MCYPSVFPWTWLGVPTSTVLDSGNSKVPGLIRNSGMPGTRAQRFSWNPPGSVTGRPLDSKDRYASFMVTWQHRAIRTQAAHQVISVGNNSPIPTSSPMLYSLLLRGSASTETEVSLWGLRHGATGQPRASEGL